jgi:hypothetical protein
MGTDRVGSDGAPDLHGSDAPAGNSTSGACAHSAGNSVAQSGSRSRFSSNSVARANAPSPYCSSESSSFSVAWPQSVARRNSSTIACSRGRIRSHILDGLRTGTSKTADGSFRGSLGLVCGVAPLRCLFTVTDTELSEQTRATLITPVLVDCALASQPVKAPAKCAVACHWRFAKGRK